MGELQYLQQTYWRELDQCKNNYEMVYFSAFFNVDVRTNE